MILVIGVINWLDDPSCRLSAVTTNIYQPGVAASLNQSLSFIYLSLSERPSQSLFPNLSPSICEDDICEVVLIMSQY